MMIYQTVFFILYFQAFEQRLRGGAAACNPTRTVHFYDSDYTTHHRPGFSTPRETFSSAPMGVTSVSLGPPHVRTTGVHRTRGGADEIKAMPHPKCITVRLGEQART